MGFQQLPLPLAGEGRDGVTRNLPGKRFTVLQLSNEMSARGCGSSGVFGYSFRTAGCVGSEDRQRGERSLDRPAGGKAATSSRLVAPGKSRRRRVWPGHQLRSLRNTRGLIFKRSPSSSPSPAGGRPGWGYLSLLVAIAMVAVVIPSAASGGTARIVSPSGDQPEGLLTLGAGDVLAAVIHLRLPLTPPPGVQQPRAWEGWSVRLVRRAHVALRGASRSLEYPARLLRIRPLEDGRYRLSALTLPWMPGGLYDLIIRGPGIEDTARRSVVVRDRGTVPIGFDLVIPGEGPGVFVEMSGVRTKPRYVTWAAVPTEGRAPARLLRFANRPAEDGNGSAEKIDYLDAPRSGKRIELEMSPSSERVDPVEWYTLTLANPETFDLVSVAWDLGGENWGDGFRVRHRWIFDDMVKVKATAFDSAGRTHEGQLQRPIKNPEDRSGCACSQAIGTRSLAPASTSARSLIGRLLDIVLKLHTSLEFFLSNAP